MGRQIIVLVIELRLELDIKKNSDSPQKQSLSLNSDLPMFGVKQSYIISTQSKVIEVGCSSIILPCIVVEQKRRKGKEFM